MDSDMKDSRKERVGAFLNTGTGHIVTKSCRRDRCDEIALGDLHNLDT